MKVYVVGNPSAASTLQQRYRRIAEVLTEAGATVSSNFFPAAAGDEGSPLMEQVDAVVIEGSDPTPEAGHLVALALTYRKPVLYLNERGRPVNYHLRRLQESKVAGVFLRLETYSSENLPNLLREFLRRAERGEGIVGPTIKFTLRLTPAIERYLVYKAKNIKKSKADYLRELMEHIAAQDEEYQRLKGKP